MKFKRYRDASTAFSERRPVLFVIGTDDVFADTVWLKKTVQLKKTLVTVERRRN